MQQFLFQGHMPAQPIIFYEVLELSLSDMESKREIIVTWLPDGIATQEQVTLLVSRQATFDDITAALIKKQATIPPEIHDRIRIFDARGHKDYKEYQPTQALSTATIESSLNIHFYAEPIPTDEDDAEDTDKPIVIIHFAKDAQRLHGIPVRFMVKQVCVPFWGVWGADCV